MMLKKKTAILFIEQDGASAKEIQVPSFLLKHWRKLGIAILSFTVIAVSSLVYFVQHNTTAKYTAVYDKKIQELTRENYKLGVDEMNNHMTAEQMKKSFYSIDSTLERINQKMKKRGLKEIAMKNVGGPIEKDENLIELSSFYDKQLKDLESKLEGIPLGKPHYGRITSRFGYRRNPFTNRGREMHSGVDLKGRTGEPIKATAKGKVTFAGYKGDYGYVVMVQHKNGYETRYAHLNRTKVRKGQSVDVGDTIGLLGSTGRSTGPHLHYEVLQYNRKINPERYFSF